MTSSDLRRIERIAVYCKEVAGFADRFGNDYKIFSSDGAYFHAVSMCIMQIGEISTNLSDEFKQATAQEVPWAQIRSMRNMFAHEYIKVDKTIVWSVVTDELPALRKFCEKTSQVAHEQPNE